MKDISMDTKSHIEMRTRLERKARKRGRIEGVVCSTLLVLLIEAMRYWT